MEEIWKEIKGYEGLYQVSSFGRVSSVTRYVKGRNRGLGKVFMSKMIRRGKILALRKNRCGYLQINLSKNAKYKTKLVHRLVADAFIAGGNKELIVNHKNLNKTDNKVDNLEFCTYQENAQHFCNIEKENKSKNRRALGSAKLKNKDVIEIIQSNEDITILSKTYGLSACSVKRIKKGLTFKHLLDKKQYHEELKSKLGELPTP